jgi:hypothetical protein
MKAAAHSTSGLAVITLLAAGAHADAGPELARLLEANAVASAYARMCDEEPMAEQLKVNTMILLAVNGLPAHNVQLGSAKFNEIMKREFAATKTAAEVHCTTRIAQARERLEQTQKILQSTRKPQPE